MFDDSIDNAKVFLRSSKRFNNIGKLAIVHCSLLQLVYSLHAGKLSRVVPFPGRWSLEHDNGASYFHGHLFCREICTPTHRILYSKYLSFLLPLRVESLDHSMK